MTLKSMTQRSDAQLKHLVIALKAENKRLQKQVAKYQVQCISLKNRVAALEADIRKRPNVTLAELLAGIDSPESKTKGSQKR